LAKSKKEPRKHDEPQDAQEQRNWDKGRLPEPEQVPGANSREWEARPMETGTSAHTAAELQWCAIRYPK
jgi:hypothetical protein